MKFNVTAHCFVCSISFFLFGCTNAMNEKTGIESEWVNFFAKNNALNPLKKIDVKVIKKVDLIPVEKELAELSLEEWQPDEAEWTSLPIFPEFDQEPNFMAPAKFNHPLQPKDDVVNQLTFMLGEDNKGFYLYAEGAIDKGAYENFTKYIAHYKKQNIELNRFMMHSPGGLVSG
jgi:hypothetical protein